MVDTSLLLFHDCLHEGFLSNCFVEFQGSNHVPFVLNFRMLRELVFHVLDLTLFYLSSADGTSLALGDRMTDHVAIWVLFFRSFHKPIPMDTDEVESVEALVDSDQVNSVRETRFFGLALLAKLFEAHSTSALNSVIVWCKNFAHFFMQVIENSSFIFVLNSLVDQSFLPIERNNKNQIFTYSSQIFWSNSSNWS